MRVNELKFCSQQAFVVSLVLKSFRVKVYTRDICEMRKQHGLREIENPLFQSQQMYLGKNRQFGFLLSA